MALKFTREHRADVYCRVQDLAQPYFLRRTKEAVLNLPPLSEVIVPLSMSPLQKVVYKSVLEKNMDALKAIYDASKAKSKKKVMTGKVYASMALSAYGS